MITDRERASPGLGWGSLLEGTLFHQAARKKTDLVPPGRDAQNWTRITIMIRMQA